MRRRIEMSWPLPGTFHELKMSIESRYAKR